MKKSIFWFKRDLRLLDNPSLKACLSENELVDLIYIFLPSLLSNKYYHPRHWKFAEESLIDLKRQLANPGLKLAILEKLALFKLGRTGFPLVDACIRCLTETGYINFRMRAMLVSFATHHLWLPWQSISAFLSQRFLDFEPGIHFPQLQLQAGVTGTNTIRIYNPITVTRSRSEGSVYHALGS